MGRLGVGRPVVGILLDALGVDASYVVVLVASILAEVGMSVVQVQLLHWSEDVLMPVQENDCL